MAEYTPEQRDQYLTYVRAQYKDKLTPEQMAQYEAHVNDTMAPKEKSLGAKALDYGIRGLDYAAGLGRLVPASIAGQATQADLEKALVGQAPQTSEYIQRAGGGEMGKLSDLLPEVFSKESWRMGPKVGGPLDITGRGALGFVGDTAFDPLTYFSLGLGPLAKGAGLAAKAGKAGQFAGKVLNPVSNLLESSGKSMYKSGLKKIDQQALLHGKEPVSDLLLREGVSGSATHIAEQMDIMAERLLRERDAIIQRATEAGGTVNMNSAMQGTVERIASLRASKDPLLQPVADALEAEVKKYSQLAPRMIEVPTGQVKTVPTKPVSIETGLLDQSNPYNLKPATVQASPLKHEQIMRQVMTPGITPEQASGMKTSLYQGLPQGAYQEMVAAQMGTSPALTRGKKVMAEGLKNETENAVGQTLGQGALDAVQKANAELGQLLTTKDKQQMQAFLEQNKNAVTSVDMGGLGFAIAGNPAAIPIMATKKLGDISKTTGFRTGVGKSMYEIGRSGLPLDIYLRRGLVEQNK